MSGRKVYSIPNACYFHDYEFIISIDINVLNVYLSKGSVMNEMWRCLNVCLSKQGKKGESESFNSFLIHFLLY